MQPEPGPQEMKPRTDIVKGRNHETAGRGFTLIELLLAIALLAVIAALALPVYSNFAIRSKLEASVDLTLETRTWVEDTCSEMADTESLAAYLESQPVIASDRNRPWLHSLEISGTCSEPVISVYTRKTGQLPNPVLKLTAEHPGVAGGNRWTCSSENTPDARLPKSCRSF